MIRLAYSPCPNDTFIFYHLVHGSIPGAPEIQEELYDVENLNEFALAGKFEATKLSFAAYFRAIDKYILLNSGAALGRGCGPLLVKRKGEPTELSGDILIPGELTTANLLLHLHLGKTFRPKPVIYHEVIPALVSGQANAGVIIHEERFTYADHGLEIIADLGQWWEEQTGRPIPLGAIAAKRDLPLKTLKSLEQGIAESIRAGHQNPGTSYILGHSQNKESSIIEQHIGLYVNDFSLDLGEEGRDAVTALYEKAVESGFVKRSALPLFL